MLPKFGTVYKTSRGFDCLTLLLVALAFASLFVPFVVSSSRQAKRSACAGNLSRLWRMQNARKPFPHETGKAFWATVKGGVTSCPVRGSVKAGEIHYLGPAKDVNDLHDSDPVGCDEPGNHGEGGMALRKSGDVLEYAGGEWMDIVSKCAR